MAFKDAATTSSLFSLSRSPTEIQSSKKIFILWAKEKEIEGEDFYCNFSFAHTIYNIARDSSDFG